MSIDRITAIQKLVGGAVSRLGDEITYQDGQTPPTEKEIDTELARLEKEFSDNEYARKRASAYPSVGDQLDMLMKDMRDGTTTHKTACEIVKNKYPK